MPLGIVSEAEYNKEQSIINGSPKPTSATVIDITRGRGDRTNAPESLRKVIGEEGIKGSSNVELARTFGVSQSSASAYKNGATSTASYGKADEDLDKHLEKERISITTTARERMMKALEAITDEKIANAKLQVASQVAKDMSSIIKNIEPHRDNDGVNVSFQFFAPPMKQINDYEVIDAVK